MAAPRGERSQCVWRRLIYMEDAMLVLQRAVNETIEIGPNVTITVTKIRNGFVKLGVSAPFDMQIVRGEKSDGWVPRKISPGKP